VVPKHFSHYRCNIDRRAFGVQMQHQGIDELESTVKETRWNNREAMRLFDNETKARQLAIEDPQHLGSDETGSSLTWLNVHMHRVENKLDQISAEIVKWKQLNVGRANSIKENDVDEWHFKEQDRRIGLYSALKKAISSQQAKELILLDLKVKCKALQKEYKKSQHNNNENNAKLKKMQEKYRSFVQKRKKRMIEPCDLSAEAAAKKQKVEESCSSGVSVGRGQQKRKSPLQVNLTSNSNIFSISGIPQHNLLTAMNGNGSATIFPGTSNDDLIPDFIQGNPSISSFNASMPAYSSAKSSSSSKLSVANNPRDVPSFISKTTLVKKALGVSSDEHNSAAISNSKVHKKQLGSFVGFEVRKLFLGHGTFTGKVTKFKRPYYTVVYEDGDEEEMVEAETLKWIVFHDE
jgi:hypothetical protein